MAVLDVEQSGNSVEIPKTAPVCETRCISVSVTNRVPTQNASPKTEKFSAQKYWGLFSNQTNPWFILWSNICDFGIRNLIFNHCSNGYKSKGRCSHLLCFAGWNRTSQSPKNRLADAAPLLHLWGSLGKAAPSQHMHLTYCCTKLTYVHTYTLLTSSNGHFEERGPMERKDGAGEQLFYTAWCFLQYVVFSWKSV